ncbi:MAG: hypothetical protein ABI954_15270 [Pyrinomonadaceae bacterium]
MTLTSQRKLYRRNGVDDWSNANETRSFQIAFEENQLIFRSNGAADTRFVRER